MRRDRSSAPLNNGRPAAKDLAAYCANGAPTLMDGDSKTNCPASNVSSVSRLAASSRTCSQAGERSSVGGAEASTSATERDVMVNSRCGSAMEKKVTWLPKESWRESRESGLGVTSRPYSRMVWWSRGRGSKCTSVWHMETGPEYQ